MRGRDMGASAALPDLGSEFHDPAHLPPGGFEALYRSNFGPLVRLAFLLTQSEEAAADLVQDVFARVFPRWQRLEDPVPYLRRSVVNASNSWHRRRRLERSREEHVEGVSTLHADELFDVLAILPARQRAAVVLRFYEDLSDSEVAEAIGCRPGTVPSLVHRAFDRMRRAIGEPTFTNPETKERADDPTV